MQWFAVSRRINSKLNDCKLGIFWFCTSFLWLKSKSGIYSSDVKFWSWNATSKLIFHFLATIFLFHLHESSYQRPPGRCWMACLYYLSTNSLSVSGRAYAMGVWLSDKRTCRQTRTVCTFSRCLAKDWNDRNPLYKRSLRNSILIWRNITT
jgi:hypothetical protein